VETLLSAFFLSLTRSQKRVMCFADQNQVLVISAMDGNAIQCSIRRYSVQPGIQVSVLIVKLQVRVTIGGPVR